MNQMRNFLLGSAGALGLMEVSGSAPLLDPESNPETLAIKALITLVAGMATSWISRLISKRKLDKADQQQKEPQRTHHNRKVKSKSKIPGNRQSAEGTALQ